MRRQELTTRIGRSYGAKKLDKSTICQIIDKSVHVVAGTPPPAAATDLVARLAVKALFLEVAILALKVAAEVLLRALCCAVVEHDELEVSRGRSRGVRYQTASVK